MDRDETQASGNADQGTFTVSVAEIVDNERKGLLKKAGLPAEPVRHFRRPQERPFQGTERDQVTILFGGLTLRQDQLLYAGLEGLGYKVARVPLPTKDDFQAGKEFGNNGQCNPTYFTVGALVNYLKRLRDYEGIPTETILSDYIFVTGSSCGPCRFGMYEAEYRLALRNAGFDGFRVLLFEQQGGYSQTGQDVGLKMNLPFFLMFLNALLLGDLLNAIACHIRPYEIEPGKTDEVMAKCMDVCKQALRNRGHNDVEKKLLARMLGRILPGGADVGVFLDQLFSHHYLRALEQCRRILNDEVEVDYTRARPIVKITGEFWAQTTEGDGNFNMFPFLEQEGAEVLVEPVATWIDYMLHFYRQAVLDRRGIDETRSPPGFWNVGKRLQLAWDHRKKMFLFDLAQKCLNREFERMRRALGSTVHPLVNQLELQRLGSPYYNSRIDGGEGHLEVAKNIYYSNRDLAHMVLSLKPFGCMPSTQSDGAQAAVISNYPDMIFLPIETSGEGDINAHSRVQMALGDAKRKCKDENRNVAEGSAFSQDEVRAYIARHRELRRPIQNVPHNRGIVSRAANFHLYVAQLMQRDSTWRAQLH